MSAISNNEPKIPQIIISILDFLSLQFSAGISGEKILLKNDRNISKRAVLGIRKKFAKKKVQNIDWTKYKPAEAAYALRMFLHNSPALIPPGFHECFGAALILLQSEHSIKAFQGLWEQMLPVNKVALKLLVETFHRWTSQYPKLVSARQLSEFFADVIIEQDTRLDIPEVHAPQDVLTELISNYDRLFSVGQAIRTNSGASFERAIKTITAHSSLVSFSESDSDSTSTDSYGTMIVHDSSDDDRPSAADIFTDDGKQQQQQQQQYGTMIVHDNSDDDRPSAAEIFADDVQYSGTMIVHDNPDEPRPTAAQVFDSDKTSSDTMVVKQLATKQPANQSASSNQAQPPQVKKKSSGAGLYREPEKWEKAIVSLERGEWDDKHMSADAFRRWKKNRPALPSFSSSSPNDNLGVRTTSDTTTNHRSKRVSRKMDIGGAMGATLPAPGQTSPRKKSVDPKKLSLRAQAVRGNALQQSAPVVKKSGAHTSRSPSTGRKHRRRHKRRKRKPNGGKSSSPSVGDNAEMGNLLKSLEMSETEQTRQFANTLIRTSHIFRDYSLFRQMLKEEEKKNQKEQN